MARPRTERGSFGNITTTGEVRVEDGRWRKSVPGERVARYRARVRVRDDDGVQRQVVRFGASRAAAERALRAALREVPEGRRKGATITVDMSVEAAAREWLRQVERPDSELAARSRAQYRSAVRNHIVGSSIASLTLREVNRVSVVRGWLQHIADTTGTGAAKTARTVLGQVVDMAVQDDVLPVNAVRQAKPARASAPVRENGRERDTARALTRAERDHVRDVADAHEHAVQQDVSDVIAFMVGTGVRIGEALGQRWDDVDLDDGTALVRGTKTAGSTRTIHLPPWLVERLRARHERKVADGRAGGVVFDSPGDPRKKTRPDVDQVRDRRNVQRIIRDVLDEAGFEWATPHTLRRTAATLLDEAGEPIAAVAQHLGHSDPSMTMRVYLDRKGSAAGAAAVL